MKRPLYGNPVVIAVVSLWLTDYACHAYLNPSHQRSTHPMHLQEPRSSPSSHNYVGPRDRALVVVRRATGAAATRARSDRTEDPSLDEEETDRRRRFSNKSLSQTQRAGGRWAEIVKKGQERAIANKKKREPVQDKKRRILMYYKEQQQAKKRASRVKRPTKFAERTPLSDLVPGSTTVEGRVISLTPFGAYVDIGTECDGLLHVSQMSRERFVEHPRQLLSPGQAVNVTVRSYCAERKKLHLTMLDPADAGDLLGDEDDREDGIALEDLEADDELWGELERVTDFGAYVRVGAIVPGFLHFMDHPCFTWPEHTGKHPSTYMSVGDRVRVWVADVDPDRRRIKLTANRPPHLPGPRRELPR